MHGERKHMLYAGAGKAVIHFPQEMLPTWEGFSKIVDDPTVEVVVVECGERFCLVNFEMVSLNDQVENYKKLVGEITGTPEENCWICVTHSLPTPHLWSPRQIKSPEDGKKGELMLAVLCDALERAARQAMESKCAAEFGFGEGSCSANVNRCVKTADGWWLGSGEGRYVDPGVRVLRFDRKDGTPIAVLFNYNCQASILDDVYSCAGERLISADLAGGAARFVEREIGGGVVAAYLLGAGGDGAPVLKGVSSVVGKDGARTDRVMHEEACVLVDLLGEKLGQEVVRTAQSISCADVDTPLRLLHGEMILKGQFIPETKSIVPRTEYEYKPADDVRTPIEILALGEAAVVGIKPEINSASANYIKEKSPFGMTAVMTFVNGGAKYMPEEELYDMITYQSMNSRFVKGSVELFRQRIVEMLEQEKEWRGQHTATDQ